MDHRKRSPEGTNCSEENGIQHVLKLYFSTLKMGAVRSYETSVNIYQTERCHFQDGMSSFYDEYWKV
jgi:hypothetical protein